MENYMYDLIIVGSGPAGLAAAIYGIRGGLDLLVLESSAMSGGQVLTTYEVDNYPGMPKTDGFELGQAFKKHADSLGVRFKTAQVTGIEDRQEKKIVRTRKEDYETKAVILAMGASHATLDITGEAEFTGRGVSYCATCDGAFYRGKTAAVVGGGDVALEDAIYLSNICEKVYIIHRRDEFRGAYILQTELKQHNNIEVIYGRTVDEICGNDMVESLKMTNVKTGEREYLNTDALFIAVGIRPNSEIIRELPILDEKGYIRADENCVTDIAGVFAAGDIRTKELRQIITAAADGANAANSAIRFCSLVK
jgi:thioredoxin reductase (NADPH)